jgi:hypothetical protein
VARRDDGGGGYREDEHNDGAREREPALSQSSESPLVTVIHVSWILMAAQAGPSMTVDLES